MFKRALYIFSSILLILFIFPAGLLISLILLVMEGMPVLFCQKRIGQNGKPFLMYKFRTMHRGAEHQQVKFASLNEAHGPVFKIHNDPRFTMVGKFFAHTGLDELPQLMNVLKGDMALIGPRPLPVAEAKRLKSWQKMRQNIKPGIISPWIVEGYHKQTFDAWMKSDIAYTQKKSFSYDLDLMFRTFGLLLRFFSRMLVNTYRERVDLQ